MKDDGTTYHLLRRLESPSIVCTILAPLMGGLEYMGRTMILSCDITRSFSSVESQMTVKVPARSPININIRSECYHVKLPVCFNPFVLPELRKGKQHKTCLFGAISSSDEWPGRTLRANIQASHESRNRGHGCCETTFGKVSACLC